MPRCGNSFVDCPPCPECPEPGFSPFALDGQSVSGDRFAWLVREDEPTTPLTMQGDDSGNNLIIQSTAGLQPPYAVGAVGPRPGATFIGGQFLASRYAADFSFMHQAPSSGAIYVSVVSGGLNNQIIFRTRNATGPGALLIWNGTLGTFQLLLVNAAAATVLLLTSTVQAGGAHVVAWRISSTTVASGPGSASPVAELYVDDVLVASGPLALAFSTASAFLPLTIATAAGYAGVNNGTNIAIAWMRLADRRWRRDELTALYTNRNTYGSRRALFSPWEMGDSITQFPEGYRRWLDELCRETPDLFKAAAGTQNTLPNIPGYDPIHDGIATQTIAQMTARAGAVLNRTPNLKTILAGTNNVLAGQTPAVIAAALQGLVDAMNAAQPGPAFYFTLPRGDGTNAPFNASVDALNIYLRANPLSNATLIDTYGPTDATSPGTASYPYANAMAADSVGHPTNNSGVCYANNAASVIGRTVPAFASLRGD